MTRTNAFILSLLVVAIASPAAAQGGCFAVTGESGERAQHLVGLHDTVRLSTGCEYGLAAQGPYVPPGAFAAREVDFIEVHRHLASTGARAGGDPRVIFGRRTGRGASEEQHTLMLRYCAHYLLEEQLGFRVVPRGSGGLRVERVTPAGCDAGRLELRATQGVGADQLHGREPDHTLAPSARSLELPEGDWSIYAARPGSEVALRIGVFRAQRVVTPLQNHIRTVGISASTDAPPLLAARWDPGGPGMLMRPTDYALSQDLLWPELRTAADAGVLWLARRRDGEAPIVLGVVQLEAGERPSVRLPDSAVRERMRALYGEEAAGSIVPTSEDWRTIFAGLAVCLTPSYHTAHRATVGGPVPDAGACASLGGLAILAQAETSAGDTPAQVCLRHGHQRLTSDGVRQELPEEPDCFRLPAPGTEERTPYRIAVAGDRIRVEGHELCVLVDGAPLEPLEGTEGEYELRAGLLEVRQSGGAGCVAPQALARARFPVLDPEHEWHPVGLYTDGSADAMQCGTEERPALCPWRSIARDESDTFAFVEPRHELEFRISTSAPVSAAIETAPNGHRELTQHVALLSGVHGQFGGTRPPALVAWLSRDGQCPTERPFAELREEPPLDVDNLLVDATFNVFLLAVQSDEEPPVCLAQARFRARSSRALVAATVADFLGMEVGLLGDTQLVFMANNPMALGLYLPIAWFRMTPGIRWLSLEIGAGVMGAWSFPGAPVGGMGATAGVEASRVGGVLTWALTVGIPEYLPRILSVGGMLHAAAETSSSENPYLSFFVGLNLSTLVDLAGGR